MVMILCEASVHKKGESPSDCQDACATNRNSRRYAIADGVANSFLAAEWARLLVRYFCDDESDLNRSIFSSENNWQEWLKPIKERLKMETIIKENSIGPLNYRIKNLITSEVGASATFIGLEVIIDSGNPSKGNCQAMVIGDSCLFIIRNDKINESFPFKESAQFTRKTPCFVSLPVNNVHKPQFINFELEAKDVIILATDGLSKWLLRHHELGGDSWQTAWEKVKQIKSWDELYEFTRRAQIDTPDPLENDDITLLMVSLAEIPNAFLAGTPATSEQDNVPEVTGNEPANSTEAEPRKFQDILRWLSELFIHRLPPTQNGNVGDEKKSE